MGGRDGVVREGAGPARRVVAHLAAFVGFLRALAGETRYDAYLAHERAHHPDRPALSEREFWRQRDRERDADPGARCC